MSKQLTQRVAVKVKAIWNGLRFILGDDAYDRYLAHQHSHHDKDGLPPLDRKTFFRQELDKKWNSRDIQRCC